MSSYSLIAFEAYRKAHKFYGGFYEACLRRVGKHFVTSFDLVKNPPQEVVWVKNGEQFSKMILRPYTTYMGNFQGVDKPIIIDENGVCIHGI